MKKKYNFNKNNLPTTKQLEKELTRVKYKARYKKMFINTIYALIIVASISIIITNLLFPLLRITGKSMEPNLTTGDIVVAIKDNKFKRGDIIAFYYNNHILVKRIIATSLEFVNMDNEGNVYINDKLLEEVYIKNKALGKINIEFPYQVPLESYFVLGDARDNSIDSRNTLIGTIKEEDIIGKVIFKVWPIKSLSLVN